MSGIVVGVCCVGSVVEVGFVAGQEVAAGFWWRRRSSFVCCGGECVFCVGLGCGRLSSCFELGLFGSSPCVLVLYFLGPGPFESVWLCPNNFFPFSSNPFPIPILIYPLFE